ncbi:thiol:disulfide interchange protein DsbA/DsbL [Methylohalobius crimeensis]|uniref:thiol:disulfide interchange protein DsbA/DsbL n=1 Tax=Methylohalobius crimeensis TaxID=244365 RepID=UPI0003B48150|nr:thiol:disulfide interchange protein DsbA/DsbL [Methylohalobius crimeensis]
MLRHFWMIVLGWCLASGLAAQEYENLNPPRSTEDPAKVEVIEFFWYGCPHCNRFDPYLEDWAKDKPDDVAFKRQPVIFGRNWAPQARAYFTAEVLGMVDTIHSDFFKAMHVDKKSMSGEEELATFFVDHGVEREAFKNAFHSFAVDMKMRQAEVVAAEYGITGVPALVVNGKYKVTGRTAKSYDNMITVLKKLVEQERRQLTDRGRADEGEKNDGADPETSQF